MVLLDKPWWVRMIEHFTDWECNHLTLHEIRFRRTGKRVTTHAMVTAL